jgi:ferredoxin
MADRKALQAEMISGHSGPSPGHGMQRDLEVCKLVDTTTCIGCKACEVACAEWNDLPFSPTTFDNTYQTMPETRWNFWNLIKFNEHQNPDGTIQWLMRKDQCMHCADLAAGRTTRAPGRGRRPDRAHHHPARLAQQKQEGQHRSTRQAGCPGLLFHDLRRSGVRNIRRNGTNDLNFSRKVTG